MKTEIKKILKEKNKFDYYTDERYKIIKDLMKYGMSKDMWLKNYLSLDPLNKSMWCADHLIKLVDNGNI